MAKQPQRRPAPAAPVKKTVPAPVRRTEQKRENVFSAGSKELIFGRTNFLLMGVGIALILLGLLAMSGGAMENPNEWKPEVIYSFRRITLAPMIMIAGFLVVIYGIFKKDKPAEADNSGDNSTEA